MLGAVGRAAVTRHAPGRRLGTHARNEPREPVDSPRRARDFIYRLQPTERACLLRELQGFESMAIVQGEGGLREPPARRLRVVASGSGGGDVVPSKPRDWPHLKRVKVQ